MIRSRPHARAPRVPEASGTRRPRDLFSDDDLFEFARMTDAELLDRITRDEPMALAEVYERHSGAVYGFALRLCGPANAEEVVRDAFLALWHHPAGFDLAYGSICAALTVDVHRRAVGMLRADTARRAVESAMSPSELVRQLRLAWADHRVDRVLDGLYPLERQAVCLLCLGGYTEPAIAERLGQTPETIRRAIQRALEQLADGLRDDPARVMSTQSDSDGGI